MGRQIVLDRDKCIKCGACSNSCPFGALELNKDTGYPEIGAGCRLCGACVKACPKGALSVSGEAETRDLSEYKGVLVFAEQRAGELADVTLELLGKGRELADSLSERLSCVILGDKPESHTKELIEYGADIVYVYSDPKYAEFEDESYATAIVDLLEETKQNILLIGATSIGRSLAPRIAVRMRTGLTADCTLLEIKEGLLFQTRPAYGGNIMATIVCPNHRPQMATVRPKVMEKLRPDPSRKGEIIKKTSKIKTRTKVLEVERKKTGFDIGDAEVIVAGGKGLGKKEGFELLKKLADVLGASLGASRPCVDEGWIDFSHQIGLSGKTVKPRVYFAVAISGSTQHLAGMSTSDTVIAINDDPSAPIFKVADYGIVGDMYEIVPALIDAFSNEKK